MNRSKVEMLASGRSLIVETGMDHLVAEGHQAGRLTASTNAADAIRESDVPFVCVGTPSLRSGKLDLGYVERAGMRDVERFMKHYFLVAKDVGDLTAILCAKLESRQAKSVPMLDRVVARLRPDAESQLGP